MDEIFIKFILFAKPQRGEIFIALHKTNKKAPEERHIFSTAIIYVAPLELYVVTFYALL